MPVPPLRGHILITGASSGIGVEFARQLAPAAKALVLVARRRERLESLAGELRAACPSCRVLVVPCDLADEAAREAMAQRVESELGQVDVLINNAGFGHVGVFELSSWRRNGQMIAVNVTALTWLCQRFLPGMVERGSGGILNVSSGFGMTWMPGLATYIGTKHFVTAFTESLACELRGTGVVVSQLCPGPVATEFEAVAGNPTGQKVPGWIEISAQQAAARGLAGFRRGRAMVVPSWPIALSLWMGQWSPRWLLRLLYSWMGPMLRKRERAARDAEAA